MYSVMWTLPHLQEYWRSRSGFFLNYSVTTLVLPFPQPSSSSNFFFFILQLTLFVFCIFVTGTKHVSMQLSRTLSGLTNLFFNRRYLRVHVFYKKKWCLRCNMQFILYFVFSCFREHLQLPRELSGHQTHLRLPLLGDWIACLVKTSVEKSHQLFWRAWKALIGRFGW